MTFHISNCNYEKLEKEMRRYEHVDTKEWGSGWLWDPRWITEKSSFGKGKTVPFEMLEIIVPDQADKVLTKNYGDWQTPVKGANAHTDRLRDMYFDTEHSYKERTWDR